MAAKEHDFNLDPISKEPGAHPVGTGIGAAMGGIAAGAAAGTVAGPVGVVIGGVAGAIAGGLGGKEAAEALDPTAEEAYWRDNYANEHYYEAGRSYDDYGPAYRLGVTARQQFPGSFEESDDLLATHWDTRRESSTLSWPQAKHATRAAWERADRSLREVSGGNAVADDEDVIETLNELLESCRDGEYGFRECAEHTKAADIKTLMGRHADECRSAGLELQTLIRQLGGTPDDGGSVSGALHRGWVSVRGTLSGYSDQAMLDECERGEDAALARYRKALKGNLPSAIRSVVERQAQGAQRNHDQVKALRDALKASD
ncbi:MULTISPECIES: PA2169 family four-helix-bundle protein [unclassified Polaromonas]|uniref:ferritin-like domain-containing protein n=1 Tax=unclassified Polaromonas TaxID=2638319 RepID=UPI000F08CCFA|nr:MULTISPECIES: PA2169 family four-helix-bundle protein [unclassified Polaromonas]AYQ29714.1 PA2169 family four-helix-bundle protein [Polaromonas sp. SP1]QGJ19171.1 PA2169 family four-helix-bundle protein [Polaromonas sp. Pch-P]